MSNAINADKKNPATDAKAVASSRTPLAGYATEQGLYNYNLLDRALELYLEAVSMIPRTSPVADKCRAILKAYKDHDERDEDYAKQGLIDALAPIVGKLIHPKRLYHHVYESGLNIILGDTLYEVQPNGSWRKLA